ncbi:MAG: hypothetical protein M1831_001863 [Alyxoria varia]|nr:MAG: hypothetical protein M1831_001863 [Alyxoria varia]
MPNFSSLDCSELTKPPDIELVANGNQKCSLPASAAFQFLAFVDPNQIPLYLAVARPYSVHTQNDSTRSWLQNTLFQKPPALGDPEASKILTPSYRTPEVRSHVGLLARVVDSELHDPRSRPSARVTEILFYAEKQDASELERLPTPPPSSPHSEDTIEAIGNETKPCQRTEESTQAGIFAVPLSSDLLYKSFVNPNEASLEENEARFVTPTRSHEPARTAKKRSNIGELFDDAVDRGKRARRKGGQSISFAACGGASTPQITMFDDKSIKTENTFMQDVNRYPSAFDKPTAGPNKRSNDQGFLACRAYSQDSRAFSRRPTVESKNSSWPQPIPTQSKEIFKDGSVEARNKQSISRIVMAGMRMYGIEQRKTALLATKQSSSSREKNGISEPEPDRNECMADNEFKSIYHQTYKGTAFAFRNTLSSTTLPPERLREVIDALLAMFCTEPG